MIDSAIACAETDDMPDPSTYLFVSDSQLMAVAIHDCCPMPHKSDYTSVEEDTLIPKSKKIYDKFNSLYGTAHDNPDSTLSQIIVDNDSLSSTLLHYFNFSSLNDSYDARCGIYGLNIILIGVLSFLAVFVKFDLAWYWSATIGVATIILARLFTPYSKLENLFHKKITYVERTIQLTNREAGGYTDLIDFAALENNNNKTWLAGIIGAILGFCFIPFPGGLLIGAILGFCIGKSPKEDDTTDYDYKKVNEGKIWKSAGLSLLLSIGCIYYLVLLIIDLVNK